VALHDRRSSGAQRHALRSEHAELGTDNPRTSAPDGLRTYANPLGIADRIDRGVVVDRVTNVFE
jgi:hypothetical protein